MAGVFDFGDHYLRVKQFEAEKAERDQRLQWEREERAARQAKQTKIDAALDRVRGLSTDGVVEQGVGDLSAGGIQQVMASGYGGTTGAPAAQELAVDNYREMQRGLRAPGATPQTQVAATQALGLAQTGPKTRKAKESEIMGAAGDALLAAGDMSGWVGMRERATNARYGEGLTAGYKAFDDLRASGGLTKFLDELSANGEVKGGFSVMRHTTGTGKEARTSEYIVYDPEGKGQPVRVDMDDARHIFALRQLMDVDPARAHAELRGMKDEQRKLAMQMLDIQFKGAGLNNDVRHKQDTMAFQRDVENRRAGIAERELALRNREIGARIGAIERAQWQPEQYVDEQGNVRVFDVNRAGRTPDFRERAMPPGLKPYKPSPELRVNQDGSVQRGGVLYLQDPKNPGAYVPAKFPGASALDRALEGDKGASMAGMRPITQRDLEIAAVDPSRLERVSKRGLFGGVTYMYRDPATGKEYSLEDYEAIQNAPR